VNALTCTSEVVFKLGDTSCFNQHPWIMHLNFNTILKTYFVHLYSVTSPGKMIFAVLEL